MSRGGYRPNAGRPKGSKDKAPRRPTAPPPDDPAAERAFLEACGAFVGTGEPFRILRDFLNSEDPSRRAWALDKILSYGVGLPGKRPDAGADDRADERFENMTAEELEAFIARSLGPDESTVLRRITDGRKD